MVMHRKVIVHPGVTIEYSGPESIVERLNSSRPTAIDLILEAGLLITFDCNRVTQTEEVSFDLFDESAQANVRCSRCYP